MEATLRRTPARSFATLAVATVLATIGLIGGVPATADAADRDSLITESDLPDELVFTSSSPHQELGYPPDYPSVDHCVLHGGTPFNGPSVTLTVANFGGTTATQGVTPSGDEGILDFPTAAAAKKFYGAQKPFFTATTKCKSVKAQSSSGGTNHTIALGKFRPLDVGDQGDESVAVMASPPNGPSAYFATFRSGRSVVRVTVTGAVPKADFVALARRAEKRFDAGQ